MKFLGIKLPWHERAALAEEERKEAEAKLENVRSDWFEILRHKEQINREIELNDWTATAIKIFTGEDPRKPVSTKAKKKYS